MIGARRLIKNYCSMSIHFRLLLWLLLSSLLLLPSVEEGTGYQVTYRRVTNPLEDNDAIRPVIMMNSKEQAKRT